MAFDVEVPAIANSTPEEATAEYAVARATAPAKMGCIFKVGDDIRQDVLAIQVGLHVRGMLKSCALALFRVRMPSSVCLHGRTHGSTTADR